MALKNIFYFPDDKIKTSLTSWLFCLFVFFLHLITYKIKHIFTRKKYIVWPDFQTEKQPNQKIHISDKEKQNSCTSFLFSLQDMRATHTHTSIKTMLQISRDVKHLLFKNFQKESLILAFWNNGNPWKPQLCGFIKLCSLNLSASEQEDLNLSPS